MEPFPIQSTTPKTLHADKIAIWSLNAFFCHMLFSVELNYKSLVLWSIRVQMKRVIALTNVCPDI